MKKRETVKYSSRMIKAISIYFYVIAALSLVLFFNFAWPELFNMFITISGETNFLAILTTFIVIFLLLLVFIIPILIFFLLGRGVWKGKTYARGLGIIAIIITTIICLLFLFISKKSGLYSTTAGLIVNFIIIIFWLINLIAVIFLFNNKNSKIYFQKNVKK